jgi:hypothetical protein
MKSSTPAIPSYVSPFLTGAMAEDAKGNWATSPTGTPSAVEMKLLADSNIYYGFAAYDPDTYTGKQAGQYQLTLGYNSTAEVSDDAKGISWGNKSDVCSGYAGLLNPSFTLSTDKKSCDLGEHGWEAAGIPAKPVVLKNYTLQFNLDAAVPTGNKVYLAGSWNAWNTGDLANELCTLSADRKTVTKVMTSVLCSTYKYGLLYEADDATALTWAHKSDSCFVADGAYTPKASQGDNYTLNIADGFNEALNFDVTIKAVISDVATGNAVAYKGALPDDWGSLHEMAAVDGEANTYSLKLTFRPYNAGKYEFGIAQCSATGTGNDRKLTQLDKLGWMGDADNPSGSGFNNLQLAVGEVASTVTVTGTFAAGSGTLA